MMITQMHFYIVCLLLVMQICSREMMYSKRSKIFKTYRCLWRERMLNKTKKEKLMLSSQIWECTDLEFKAGSRYK